MPFATLCDPAVDASLIGYAAPLLTVIFAALLRAMLIEEVPAL